MFRPTMEKGKRATKENGQLSCLVLRIVIFITSNAGNDKHVLLINNIVHTFNHTIMIIAS